MAARDEMETVIVLPMTLASGAKRYIVWNRRTDFQQRCRTDKTAMRLMKEYNEKEH